jgi:hypothetical protein
MPRKYRMDFGPSVEFVDSADPVRAEPLPGDGSHKGHGWDDLEHDESSGIGEADVDVPIGFSLDQCDGPADPHMRVLGRRHLRDRDRMERDRQPEQHDHG